MNRRELGKQKEQQACLYLQKKGYQIRNVNYWCRRFGEIDIVAQDGDYLVFVEVKYRSSNQYGGAMYAVSPRKQKKLWDCAGYYIVQEGVAMDTNMRFDVVLIEGEEIVHIENAFEAGLA